MRAAAILLAAFLLGPSPGVAADASTAEDPIATAREACTDKDNQTDMNLCTYELHKQLDAELKRTYDALLARVTAKADKKRLRHAQRSWAIYLAQHCTFQTAGVVGGSVQPTIYNLCALELTELRLKELAYHLTCEEGDLSCPYPARN